ncbi:hypothetical protein PV761_19995 [Arthrobacter sp. CC3]|uniref:hypothetical protein n=1 Tax=Arthrobacter sp. CC3 TaxID=3029185 RepID=UPI00326517F0
MPTPRALRPFVHREYRVLIAALAVSIFGSGMWAVGMVYQVIHLGGGPLELSLVATAGRVSSLDFFVSLALMPVSMALAGPAAAVVPTWVIFLVAGGVCPVMAVVALVVARMPADELAHPLDRSAGDRETADSP